jgi:HK97 family phage portal protein
MNPFRKFGRFLRKDDQSRVLIALTAQNKTQFMSRDIKTFSDEGYKKCVVVYSSIQKIAVGAGGVPWILYKKGRGKGSKTRVEQENHPFLDLMARPNPIQGLSAFMQNVIGYYLIAGNSYISAVGDKKGSDGQIRELWTQRPDRMKLVAGARGFPARYIYSVNNQDTVYEVDQVSLKSPILHLKTFNPLDDWYGMSPLESAAYQVDQYSHVNKWNLGLLQNGARPSGALVATVSANSPGFLPQEQFNRLKEQIETEYSGSANAGKPMLLEGGLDWKQFGLNPQQMEFVENKNTSARDIALAFGVPPMLLGLPGDNTYANYSEARQSLYEETILPLLDFIRDEFNHWLVPNFGDSLVCDYDKDEVHALAPRRAEIWDKVSSASFLTENEKRIACGYEAIEDGDVILVQSTMGTLEQITEDPEEQEGDQSGDDLSQIGDTDQDEDDEAEASEDEEESEDGKPAKPGKSLFQVKLFNLRSDRSKVKEWRGQQRLKRRFEKRLQRQAHAVFELEGQKVADVIHGLDAGHAEHAIKKEIDANKEVWRRMLTANVTSCAKAFKDRFDKSIKNAEFAIEKKSDGEYDEAMREWIRNHVGERIDGISETTKKRVIEAIRDAQEQAYDEGTPISSFSDAVKEAYDGFSEDRAVTIARTEMGTAANMSLMTAAQSADIPGLQKEWISTNDERTRDDHRSINGQMVPIDEDFDVGGVKMSQPGDPNGPADEVINCRCGVVFSKG